MLILSIYEKFKNMSDYVIVSNLIKNEFNTNLKIFWPTKIMYNIFPIKLTKWKNIIEFIIKINNFNFKWIEYLKIINIKNNKDIYSEFILINNKIFNIYQFFYLLNNDSIILNQYLDNKNYTKNDIIRKINEKKLPKLIFNDIIKTYKLYGVDNFIINDNLLNYFIQKNNNFNNILFNIDYFKELIILIFNSYTRKKQINDNLMTFKDYIRKNYYFTLQDFLKFCYDFKISKLLDKNKFISIFNKYNKTGKMDYNKFYKFLIDISYKNFQYYNELEWLKHFFLFLNIKNKDDINLIIKNRDYKNNFSNENFYDIQGVNDSIKFNNINKIFKTINNNNFKNKKKEFKINSKSKLYMSPNLSKYKTNSKNNLKSEKLKLISVVKNSYSKKYLYLKNKIDIDKVNWKSINKMKLKELELSVGVNTKFIDKLLDRKHVKINKLVNNKVKEKSCRNKKFKNFFLNYGKIKY